MEPRTWDAPGEPPEAISFFLSQRPRLFRIAYRVTGGDVPSAEDVVQEAWLRWQRTDRTAIRNPEAFLTTMATRLAINVIQSAPRRHEIPNETLATEAGDATTDPFERADRAGAVAQALAVLMVRLTPAELAAYVLRGLFDYSYADLSQLLRTSPVNVRQLVSRARWRITRDIERPVVEPRARRRLVEAFLTASRSGDVGDLEQLLVREVRPQERDGAEIRLSRATVQRPSGSDPGTDPVAEPGRSRAHRKGWDRRPDGRRRDRQDRAVGRARGRRSSRGPR